MQHIGNFLTQKSQQPQTVLVTPTKKDKNASNKAKFVAQINKKYHHLKTSSFKDMKLYHCNSHFMLSNDTRMASMEDISKNAFCMLCFQMAK